MTTLLTKLRTNRIDIDETTNTLYTWIRAIRERDEKPTPRFMELLVEIAQGRHDETRYMVRTNGGGRIGRLLKLIRNNHHDAVFCCEDCDGWEWEDDSNWAYQDNQVCSNCIDNYTWSDYQDQYISHSDYEDEQEEEDSEDRDEYIYEYDENILDHCAFTQSDKDRVEVNPLYMGVELEVERRKDCPYEIGEMTSNDFYFDKGRFAIMKADGSLSNGFEIVTCPATLNAHRESWDKFFNGESIKNLKSWNTDTTGMHIHIARNHLTQLDIGKLLVFINDENNEDFVNHIAGRNSDQWAKKSSKKISDALQSSEKYEAVNMSHRNTIEFRIFKGNLAKQGMFRVIEFVHALVGFSKTTSMSKLSYKDFIKYMELPQNRSEYKIFYGWLTRKSYCIGKPSRKIDWTDEQSNLKEIA